MTKKTKHHVMVTVAVGLGTFAHIVFELFAPELIHLSPLAGFGASLLWIWSD